MPQLNVNLQDCIIPMYDNVLQDVLSHGPSGNALLGLEWWGFNSRTAPWACTKWSLSVSPMKKVPLSTDFVEDVTAQSQAHLGTYLMAENTSTPKEEKGL